MQLYEICVHLLESDKNFWWSCNLAHGQIKKSSSYGILCNAKRRCVVFVSAFPSVTFNGQKLKFVTHFEYLEYIINKNLSDKDNIKREIKYCFLNLLGLCSHSVQLRGQ